MTYTYAYNREKGVYEIKSGNKIIVEKNTMQEAKAFADGKNGISKNTNTKKSKKVLGFGEWETPAFFMMKAK